jgi:hypothetical protein
MTIPREVNASLEARESLEREDGGSECRHSWLALRVGHREKHDSLARSRLRWQNSSDPRTEHALFVFVVSDTPFPQLCGPRPYQSIQLSGNPFKNMATIAKRSHNFTTNQFSFPPHLSVQRITLIDNKSWPSALTRQVLFLFPASCTC